MIGSGAQRAAPEPIAGKGVEGDEIGRPGNRGTGAIPVAATAHVQHRAGPPADGRRRDRAGGNDAGDGARGGGGDGVRDEAVLGAAQVLAPGRRAVGMERVLVAVPGADVDQPVRHDRLGRDRPVAQAHRPAGLRLERGSR